jgi:hypothetical protein
MEKKRKIWRKLPMIKIEAETENKKYGSRGSRIML